MSIGNSSSDAPIILKNDRLEVVIAQPGTHYNGTRFDWSGFITQVTLDGRHTFCMPESLRPGRGTGGSGLCNEFGIEKSIGYDETPVGGSFPKLGIGLLKRPDEEPYRFMRPYEIVEEFPIIIDARQEQVTFYMEPVACMGYAARLQKTISISGPELTIAYRLENAGDRDIVTHEYCHNFLCINNHQIGPEYTLSMPYPIKLEQLQGQFDRMLPRWMRTFIPRPWLQKLVGLMVNRMMNIFAISGNEIRWTRIPDKAFYCRLQGYHRTDQPQWSLLHEPSGVQIQEYDDFAPGRVAVWGVEHVVSAEVFVDIDLKPGQTFTWQRRYVMTGAS